jgi:hypothetical protein
MFYSTVTNILKTWSGGVVRSDLWTPLKKENNVLITNRAGNRLRIEKCWLAVAKPALRHSV